MFIAASDANDTYYVIIVLINMFQTVEMLLFIYRKENNFLCHNEGLIL